ncbi:MAG: hypothetical protein HFJ45_09520 [Clostridia bacterium]|nr:hypothetical protein [Clostridia bacterium]
MYYENKKNGFWGVLLPLLILGFLSIIVVILVNLINRVDVMANVNNLDVKETGTDTVLNDFGIENLVENSSYSIVRSI